MSMQSLLVVSGYGSVREAFLAACYGGHLNNPAIKRCVAELSEVRASFHSDRRDFWRTVPDLARGVKSQQYPQMGALWPYVKRKQAHYRKQKRRDYIPRPLDCGDGIEVWSQAGKRFAKRVNNKRRRAEDRREIAREMDLWAQDSQASLRLDADDIMTYFSSDGTYWCSPKGSANVYVPPHPKCFAGHVTYGNVSIRVGQGFDMDNFDDYDFFNKD